MTIMPVPGQKPHKPPKQSKDLYCQQHQRYLYSGWLAMNMRPADARQAPSTQAEKLAILVIAMNPIYAGVDLGNICSLPLKTPNSR